MACALEENDWNTLLRRIKAGKCTPFLGAGVNSGILTVGSEIAQKLAETHRCPFKDTADLARVTQVLAVENDPMYPKEEVLRLLSEQLEKWKQSIDINDFFGSEDQPLGVLAGLPLPIYMTTNYDNLIVKALETHRKDPKRELCRWNKYVTGNASVFDSIPTATLLPARDGAYDRQRCNIRMEKDASKSELDGPGISTPIRYCRKCEFACPVGR